MNPCYLAKYLICFTIICKKLCFTFTSKCFLLLKFTFYPRYLIRSILVINHNLIDSYFYICYAKSMEKGNQTYFLHLLLKSCIKP